MNLRIASTAPMEDATTSNSATAALYRSPRSCMNWLCTLPLGTWTLRVGYMISPVSLASRYCGSALGRAYMEIVTWVAVPGRL